MKATFVFLSILAFIHKLTDLWSCSLPKLNDNWASPKFLVKKIFRWWAYLQSAGFFCYLCSTRIWLHWHKYLIVIICMIAFLFRLEVTPLTWPPLFTLTLEAFPEKQNVERSQGFKESMPTSIAVDPDHFGKPDPDQSESRIRIHMKV
jgi:hypothetical protein